MGWIETLRGPLWSVATAPPIVPRLIRASVILGSRKLTSHRFQTCHARKVRILSARCQPPIHRKNDAHLLVFFRSAAMPRVSAFRAPTAWRSRLSVESQHRNEKRCQAAPRKLEILTGDSTTPFGKSFCLLALAAVRGFAVARRAATCRHSPSHPTSACWTLLC